MKDEVSFHSDMNKYMVNLQNVTFVSSLIESYNNVIANTIKN